MTAPPTLLFCLGATKAGTTWLYEHLAAHPECHLRRIKELHYFTAVESGALARAARAGAADLAKPGKRMSDRKRRDLADWLEVLRRGAEDIPAYLGYLCGGLGTRRLVADITPAYALLPEARLRQMAGIAPDVRFLYLLRDPVARLWSQVRMMAERAASTEAEVPALAHRLLARLLSGEAGPASFRLDYAGALRRLVAAVLPERRMVAFNDEVLTPEGMPRLWSFLGLGPGPVDTARRVFPGVPVTLTVAEAAAARAYLAPQYAAVEAHFGRLPASWRRTPEEMAA